MTTTSTTPSLTIEDLEALATALEADAKSERDKLQRLVRAYARILSAREPGAFRAVALEYADEDGHWDSSYPPEQVYRDRNGPRLLEVAEHDWETVATSGGYYHQWEARPGRPGIYVARDGSLWGCEARGHGRLGQYAAHPGDCDVLITLDWSLRREVELEELRQAEAALRARAFPLAAAALQSAG